MRSLEQQGAMSAADDDQAFVRNQLVERATEPQHITKE